MIGAQPCVAALSRSPVHGFSKQPVQAIKLIAGIGIAGDAHAGVTVKHRSRVAVDPAQPNLRQVSLLSLELIADYAAAGFEIAPGQLGENVTTAGIDLHALPRGTKLQFGRTATIELTGLRNPCVQIENFRPGLLSKVVKKGAGGEIARRAGVMAIVISGGDVAVGDAVAVLLPPKPWAVMERV
ncbi:MOSC domain-containing protein [Sandarakinorhabdus sp.]|uniref:MOSC domain-containing protein n=1 Tax=Sandarakinorhabdus sp. TaxID=1916663 RepID=UPI003F70FAAA